MARRWPSRSGRRIPAPQALACRPGCGRDCPRICWICVESAAPQVAWFAAEQHEEAGLLAARAAAPPSPGGRSRPAACRGLLELAELVGAAGLIAAAVERLELGLEPARRTDWPAPAAAPRPAAAAPGAADRLQPETRPASPRTMRQRATARGTSAKSLIPQSPWALQARPSIQTLTPPNGVQSSLRALPNRRITRRHSTD